MKQVKSSCQAGRQTHGFTLIELLVVIAIISLLVSILLPSLNRAKALAREVVCLSAQKQIGLCFMFYGDENRDYMCGAVADNYTTPWEPRQHWYNLLSGYAGQRTEVDGVPYYGYPDVFTACSEFEITNAWNPGYGVVFWLRGYVDDWDSDTAYFNMIDGSPSTGTVTSGAAPVGSTLVKRFYRRTEFLSLHTAGWMGESQDWHIGGGSGEVYAPPIEWPSWCYPAVDGLPLGKDPERHMGRSNVLFADGHAKSYKYDMGGYAFYNRENKFVP